MSIHKYLNIFSKLLSIRTLTQITSQRIILPFYHTISDKRLPHISNLYPLKSKKQFIDDIDFLCKHFTPVSIDELKSIIYNNEPVSKPVFHLTFDDGLKELYTEIAPVLVERGIPATIFVNTDFIDNKGLFYRYKVSLLIELLEKNNQHFAEMSNILQSSNDKLPDIKKGLLSLNWNETTKIDQIAELINLDFNEYLERNQPYLLTSQLNELIAKGFTIGSHSLNHPFFKDIGIDEQKHQISDSFKFIDSMFHVNNRYFSFPFSDEKVSNQLFDWLYDDINCQLSFGISGLKHDYSKFHLHRIPFENSIGNAQDIIKTEYLYYMLKSVFNKNRITRL